MKFQPSLIKGTLIRRYKRFLADVQLADKSIVLAHVPNSGSMIGVQDPGSVCYVSESSNPKRKLKYTLEIVQSKKTLVGVNTSITNKLVAEAFSNRAVSDWHGFHTFNSEVKVSSKSRLDFCLISDAKKRFVEVKNVSMARPPQAVFPDAVTERGQKHLLELMSLTANGYETEIVFVAQRDDVETFSPCDDIDPEYGRLLREAHKAGVSLRSFKCHVCPKEVTISTPLKILL